MLPADAPKTFFECLLLSDGAVPVKAAAFKEAVPHHALPKEEKDDGQDDYKQELSNPERGWVSSCGRSVVHGLLSQKAPRCNLWSRLVKQQGQKADHRLAKFVFRSSLCGRLCRFHRLLRKTNFARQSVWTALPFSSKHVSSCNVTRLSQIEQRMVGIRLTHQAPTDCGLPSAFLRSG